MWEFEVPKSAMWLPYSDFLLGSWSAQGSMMVFVWWVCWLGQRWSHDTEAANLQASQLPGANNKTILSQGSWIIHFWEFVPGNSERLNITNWMLSLIFFPSFSFWEVETYEGTDSKSAKVLTWEDRRQRARKPVDGEAWTRGKLLNDVDGRLLFMPWWRSMKIFSVDLPWTHNHLHRGLDFACPGTPVLAHPFSESSNTWGNLSEFIFFCS